VISVSKLLGGARSQNGRVDASGSEPKPVVRWQVTRTCNLACVYCSSDSHAEAYPSELNGAQARALLEDLARFEVRAVVLSGGEPLVRRDTLDLAEYGRALGLTFELATNGTLLDLDIAWRIREIGFGYVDISLDGTGPTNDILRGKPRAFERAVHGIRTLTAVGQKVGVRLTITPQTFRGLDAIFDFIENEGINRAVFQHWMPSDLGRGEGGLTNEDCRLALRTIARRARALNDIGNSCEILTAGNTADGPFLREMRAPQALPDGSRSAPVLRFCDIDSQGNVYPEGLRPFAALGNVKERKFSEIWTDPNSERLTALRDRQPP
jgi:MoaA/NifB/PqqE/SkfB family radical SAM enzyme